MLTANKHAWKSEYKKFMAETDVDGVDGILEGKKWPLFLGSKEFAGWVKGKFYAIKRDDEIPPRPGNWLRKRNGSLSLYQIFIMLRKRIYIYPKRASLMN